jgi:hypothetical protein
MGIRLANLQVFVHHVTEYINSAKSQGFSLVDLQEHWYDFRTLSCFFYFVFIYYFLFMRYTAVSIFIVVYSDSVNVLLRRSFARDEVPFELKEQTNEPPRVLALLFQKS